MHMKLTHYPLALKELGFRPVLYNALYRLKILGGYYRLVTPPSSYTYWRNRLGPVRNVPEFIPTIMSAAKPGKDDRLNIIAAADEIVQGTIRLYGVIPTSIHFKIQAKSHWTDYASGRLKTNASDIKDLWEPARFSWACTLAQAFDLSHDEKYPSFFWEQLGVFLENNPPNLGPHWMNGQEVALRLIALVFAWQSFRKSPSSKTTHIDLLRSALAAHANRINKTLIYARSQRNNHLLSEAAGLYTAALFLPELRESRRWKQTGWNLLIEAWHDQIAPDGSYIQQSVNYHRLMLQLAIWIQALSSLEGANTLPEDVKTKIDLAFSWLEGLVLSGDGQTPNMGSNDGANILPLGGILISDYRPVIQLGRHYFPSGKQITDFPPQQVIILKGARQSACMRVARYNGRPSHADQLHLDLWWNDLNLALDAGTFRYNHATPWDNALSVTSTHNTLTIDNEDQMIRAGHFLWLRQAQIQNLDIHRNSAGQIKKVSAQHDGYRHSGAIHKRGISVRPGGKPGWLIQDDILPMGGIPTSRSYAIRLAWLLPDWEWEMDGLTFRLLTPAGVVRLEFSASGADDQPVDLVVHRAGEALTPASESNPVWGWYSPTYGVKEPALAVHFHVKGTLPMQLITHWHLPA
jgi:hypothetical protein